MEWAEIFYTKHHRGNTCAEELYTFGFNVRIDLVLNILNLCPDYIILYNLENKIVTTLKLSNLEPTKLDVTQIRSLVVNFGRTIAIGRYGSHYSSYLNFRAEVHLQHPDPMDTKVFCFTPLFGEGIEWPLTDSVEWKGADLFLWGLMPLVS